MTANTTWATFDATGVRVTSGNAASRCASLLKPVYAWVAGERASESAIRSVTRSDNAATDVVVAAGGGLAQMLAEIERRTGTHLATAATWGRVLVTASEAAAVFASMLRSAIAGDEDAMRVMSWMRAMVPAQRLDLDTFWAHLCREPATAIGVKMGWDLSEDEPFARTHVVLLTSRAGLVVLTAAPVDSLVRREWNGILDTAGPEALLPLHARLAGDQIKRAICASSRG